ncbi:MAG: ABC transporter permease [Chloroflexota bacterium]|nr:ABC transporter permease [Chloroflexota bacterium]
MLRYITTRIVSSLVILWVISVLVFWLMNVLPGDPAAGVFGQYATPEQVEAFRERTGLNRPLVERYGDWIFNALQGELGGSLLGDVPITETFARRVPATMELGILSLMVVIGVAIPVGVLAALRPGSKTEVAASTMMIVGSSIPEFLTGIALVIVLGLELGWFPVVGYVPFWEDPVDNLKHMALPVIAISLTATTLLMRQTRSAMINVLNDDYIRTARAKGLAGRVVLVRHGLRNALIPIVTVFGFQAGLIFSGAVITEQVFNIPGMGRLFVESVVETQDYAIVQNTTMFFAAAVILVNLLVDLSYPLFDPRVRLGAEGDT